MIYHSIFEMSQKGYHWWVPGMGLLLFIIGLIVFSRAGSFQRTSPVGTKVKGWVYMIFCFLWTVVVFTTTWSSYQKAVQAYREGHYQTVEGTVQDFVPMPYSGHALESFNVDGRIFRYSDYVENPGFCQTRSHGGPIHEGLRVRIGYIRGTLGNIILKLEIAE